MGTFLCRSLEVVEVSGESKKPDIVPGFNFVRFLHTMRVQIEEEDLTSYYIKVLRDGGDVFNKASELRTPSEQIDNIISFCQLHVELMNTRSRTLITTYAIKFATKYEGWCNEGQPIHEDDDIDDDASDPEQSSKEELDVGDTAADDEDPSDEQRELVGSGDLDHNLVVRTGPRSSNENSLAMYNLAKVEPDLSSPSFDAPHLHSFSFFFASNGNVLQNMASSNILTGDGQHQIPAVGMKFPQSSSAAAPPNADLPEIALRNILSRKAALWKALEDWKDSRRFDELDWATQHRMYMHAADIVHLRVATGQLRVNLHNREPAGSVTQHDIKGVLADLDAAISETEVKVHQVNVWVGLQPPGSYSWIKVADPSVPLSQELANLGVPEGIERGFSTTGPGVRSGNLTMPAGPAASNSQPCGSQTFSRG